MTTFEDLVEALRPLAEQTSALYAAARCRLEPEVDDIIRGGCRDVKRIEHTLDGLLDYGDDETCLRLYKRLCRHYWTIDKVATAEYVMIYLKMWTEQDTSDPEREPTP